MASLIPVDHDPFADQAQPQQGLPVITDDGSNWASQPNLTPVNENPFGPNDRGPPVWSSSPLSLVPVSRYANGSYGFDSNAGMLGTAKRAGQSVLHSIENLPNLYHQVGAETAANTASPQTAGQVANLATLTAPVGDVRAAGAPGTMAIRDAAIPTSAELHAGASADYDAMRNLDVHYDPDHVASMAQGTMDALSNQGWSNETASKTHAVLSKLANPDSSAVSVPLNGLAQARTILGRIGQGADRSDAAAAKSAKNALDSFIANPDPQAVLAGPADLASAYLQRANGDYAAAMRSNKINGIGDYAQFRTAGAHSGANLDNTLRQQLRPLFDPRFTQRRLAGFTDPEKEALSGVVEGTPLRNSLRNASSYMGGGGGGVAALEGFEGARLGNEYAGPMGAVAGAAVPIVGRGLRTAQNNMAQSALNKADELIRSRSPMYQERLANAPLKTVPMPEAQAVIGVGRTANAQAQPNESQPAYAKGGKVKKPSHEFLVNRLMALAERAKRAEKKATAPILNMPDDTVTAALAKAQEAI